MSRFAYLIMAHDAPTQLAGLVDWLCPAGGPDRAFVHIDRKSGMAPQRHRIANPVAVHWGHVSQLEAIRRLLRAALETDFTHAHLISGADWPIASRDRIAAEAGDRCWIEAVPGEQADRMARFRLDSRWLRPSPDNPFDWYRSRVLRALSQRLPRRTSQPWGPWHKGSTWWSLPRDVCETVLHELDHGFARFHATVCVDEHAIQTIVAHHFPDRIEPHRRFMLWPTGSASPAWLTAADWPAATASGAWFARKLSLAVDPFFIDLP